MRKLTLEERIARLEKMIANESAADFTPDMQEAVEDWFWDKHDSVKQSGGNRWSRWVEELLMAKAGNTRNSTMLGDCIAYLDGQGFNPYSCQQQISNCLRKLATKARREEGITGPGIPNQRGMF